MDRYGAPQRMSWRFSVTQLEASELSDSVIVLVSMHHNPVKGTAGWMKDIGLQNPRNFWETAKKSSKLRAVYGHIHQELDFEFEGIRCLCTPSTCIQFKPDVVNFALDKMNPGYRNLVLHSGGSIETQVIRVAGEQLKQISAAVATDLLPCAPCFPFRLVLLANRRFAEILSWALIFISCIFTDF